MYDGGRGSGHPDEDEGFDDHYFRRRPKSVCMSANSADGRRFIPPTYGGLPPSASAHLPPHTLGIPTEPTYPPHAPPPHQANVAAVANVGAVVDPNDHHRMAMMVSLFQSY